ncbi:gamma-glutamyl-gamma-aminobutyrate hydrolase family protein [Deinococcus hopiensis]|uniref:Putative glutamine amidotransferase n=1 Tax=Deinococcus hopiensis KR-140 TaxID=695939 RepID=A0A1W1UJU3_9DEIO|nr:gamma-glutamyl-gamma-aminobutyrate hydrolase family protein [Deinococcus hopiensis]SMB81337.1 putative glutamine amidotransferase [Deinococcus hopiensis KR-140]
MTFKVGYFRSSRMQEIEFALRSLDPGIKAVEVATPTGLRDIDVLLGGGGPDLNPALYGEADEHCKRFSPDRDLREYQLLDQALEKGIPFLGLCRGAQLLNVLLGGTLYQDVEKQQGGEAIHDGHQVHQVQFSGLGSRYMGKEALVNSNHHQGVKTLASGLTLIGSAPDGLPEAWHTPGAIGVQFHPESLVKDDPRWLAVFRWWLEGAA